MREEIAIPFIVFASVFGYLAWRRYLEYRETVALAEKGLVKPHTPGDGKDSLRWGIVLTGLGLALTLGMWPIGFVVGGEFPLGIGPWLLPGLVTLFVGLGLILVYMVTRPDPRAKPNGSAASPSAPGSGGGAAPYSLAPELPAAADWPAEPPAG
jgi:hypothetical protein